MQLLTEIIIIYALALLVLLVFSKLKIPTVVGFLLTGIIAGPYGFGTIADVHDVEVLAEIGVLLLLFSIGIELSLKKLIEAKKMVLLGGFLQMGLTIAITFGVAQLFGMNWNEAVFLGFLFALSSTAIVLKLLQDQSYINSIYGKTSLAILIFQDIAIVPLMLITPFLASNGDFDNAGMFRQIGLGLGLIVVILLAARYVVPKLFHHVAKARNRELFLLFIVVICFSVAFMTYSVGLSLALGAFMAGLIVSESEYSHNALSSILPLKDLFTSLFFVSVGMLLNVTFLYTNLEVVLLVTLGVVVLKAVVLMVVGVLLRLTLRTTLLTAFALFQVGEFAFILSKSGLEAGLIAGQDYQLFLSVSILSMIITPFVMMFSPKFVDKAVKNKVIRKLNKYILPIRSESRLDESVSKYISDHLIIIGYGLNGRNLAKAAKYSGINYVIIESNPETVLTEKSNGENIFFGDATQEGVLMHAGIDRARICVIAISDLIATERITSTAAYLNPQLFLIVRTRFLTEVPVLKKLGADEVIPEEFETSIEIFSRVLNQYLVPKGDIENYISRIRAEGYQMFRSLNPQTKALPVPLSDLEVITVTLPESTSWKGKTLAEVGLRQKYGVTVLSIKKGDERIQNPSGEIAFAGEDQLIVLGSPQELKTLKGEINDQEK